MLKFIPEIINDDRIAIKAFENDFEIGQCVFCVNGYTMIFEKVDCNDDLITEGLARAAMNYAANRNAYIAQIRSKIACEAFIRLGFVGDELLSAEIPEALGSSCSGCCHNA